MFRQPEAAHRRSLLIVRPPQRAAADAALCAQFGWHGIAFSPMAIEPLPWSGSLKQRLQQADAVFWVSPTAVETAAAAGAFSGSLKNVHHAAVGRATARALQQAGAEHIACSESGNDSEAARQLPLWQQLPAGAQVCIAGGEGGRTWLAEQLRGLGLQAEMIDLYRRVPQPVDWAQFQAARPTAAWITSAALVENLFAQVPPNMAQSLQSLLYFAHHPRICAALARAGAQHIAAADDLQAVLIALNAAENER